MGGKGGGFNLDRIFGMLGFKGPKKFYSSYAGKNSVINNVFDPGGFLIKGEQSTPRPPEPPPDTEAIAASAAAREEERRRLASNGRPSVLSGRRADALSASIGKRTLGGGM